MKCDTLMKFLLLPLVLLCSDVPSLAQDVVVGIGYSSFLKSGARDSGIFGFEVHSRPKWRLAGADLALAAAVDLHGRDEYWVGAGVSAVWGLRRDWFVEASVLPGYYDPGRSGNSLGSHFEIRSLVGVGVALNERLSVSLAFTHKSNAGTANINPGVNALMLRSRISF